MRIFIVRKGSIIIAIIGILICLAIIGVLVFINSSRDTSGKIQQNNGYTILAMNDSGMHCYQSDYSGFLILPPANTIKVQVIKKEGDTAELINSGINISYELINNTTSADKTNFWKYAKDYGYDVPPNIGITGNGLKGNFKISSDGKYYEATAIPVTPYNDGSTERNPYQLVHIKVTDMKTGKLLIEIADVVVPVSDEMTCSVCHGTKDTDLKILQAHDELSGTSLTKDLAAGMRFKCSDCHSDSALSQSGKPGILPLSQAMHGFHADKMTETTIDPKCYSCHPGPVTQCYRGAMYLAGVSCDDPKCHGDMANIAQSQANGRKAWLNEPDCGTCHGTEYSVNFNLLYRNSYLLNSPDSDMNNLILCESCHNGPHAEWVSSVTKDNLLPIRLMGYPSYINKCSVCHVGNGNVHIGEQ